MRQIRTQSTPFRYPRESLPHQMRVEEENGIELIDDSTAIDPSPTGADPEKNDTLRSTYIDGKRRLARLHETHTTYHISHMKALKEHGAASKNAVLSEVRQMMEKGVFEFIDEASLPEKAEIIGSHLFLKLNNKGILKARLVAGEMLWTETYM